VAARASPFATRAMALLATAYERPVEPYVLAKLQRACELWNADEKALAHIHLAHARLPPCNEDHTLRLFVAEELLESGVTPTELMKAQGFDPTLLKFNPDQLRVPAGSGRESGRWTSDGAVIPVSHRTRARMKALGALIEWLRTRLKGSKHESPPEKAPPRELSKLREPAVSRPKPSDFVDQDFGKLGTAVEKPDIDIKEITGHANERMTDYGQSFDDIKSTVSDPLIVLRQSDGRYYFLSDNGAVVLDRQGRVVTTYPSWKFEDDVKAILDHVHNGGEK
jgi:hypothetical protein